MKNYILIFFLFIILSFSCVGQTPPIEKYYASRSSIVGSMTSSVYAEYEKSTLYFNDKLAILTMDGFPKSPLLFHVWSKKIDIDGDLVLQCFTDEVFKAHKDSTELKHMLTSLTITIDTKTKYNFKPSLSIHFLFLLRGMTIDFSSPYDDSKDLTSVRNRYLKFINENM
jgi:hypothetical protein